MGSLRQPAVEASLERILSGDRRALSRALTQIESRAVGSEALLKQLFPHSGKARRYGVTGAPGAGKSTLVNALVSRFRREEKKVAVVAVDPTSPFTGGSILGDRVRMQEHHADPGVFVRSMATRGCLGGLAATTADVVCALEAAGHDIILIETVGVGQAEVDIVKLAAIVALVLTPSMGDDVQTMKAGIMEIADIYVINKSDQPGADRVEQQLRAMLHLLPPGERAQPAIVRTVASEGTGVDSLVEHFTNLVPLPEAAVAYWRQNLLAMLRENALESLRRRALSPERLDLAARQAAAREINPYEFVAQILREAKFK